MPLDRFFVTVDGHQDKGKAFDLGFQWLLGRTEQDLHIAFNRADNRSDMLKHMQTYYAGSPQLVTLFKILDKEGHHTLADGRRITIGLMARVQARPNGACLGVWVDTKQVQEIEKALGPVGAICVARWFPTDIDGWIASTTPQPQPIP